MSLNWIDVTEIPINVLLLMEKEQIGWFPGWLPEKELGIVFTNHPHIAWYFMHKNPNVKDWVNMVIQQTQDQNDPVVIKQAEKTVLNAMQDLVIYVWKPEVYDQLDFLDWDPQQLLSITNFKGKTVIDIGSGTGKQSFIALSSGAKTVFSIEPVENLRHYMTKKAQEQGYNNLYCLNGVITKIPLPDNIADITMEGHVLGDNLKAEMEEMERVTKPGGCIIHIPGNTDRDNEIHQMLLNYGYQWERFEEPGDGIKRKYWKVK